MTENKSNHSCWFMPGELGKVFDVLFEAGITASHVGHMQELNGVRQAEYRFKTKRECDYVMFRMYGWYYANAGRKKDGTAYYPKRKYEWKRPVPGIKGERWV